MLSDNEIKVLRQMLEDSGCGSAETEKFIRCRSNGTCEDQLAVLFHHRKRLLSDSHKIQRQIECLDYLIYKLKRNDFKIKG